MNCFRFLYLYFSNNIVLQRTYYYLKLFNNNPNNFLPNAYNTINKIFFYGNYSGVDYSCGVDVVETKLFEQTDYKQKFIDSKPVDDIDKCAYIHDIYIER